MPKEGRLPLTSQTPQHKNDSWENDPINWPLTPESAVEFHDSFGDLRMSGYEIANDHYVSKLNQILDNTYSYNELKKELTDFVRDREKFAEFLEKRFNDKTGGYHIS